MLPVVSESFERLARQFTAEQLSAPPVAVTSAVRRAAIAVSQLAFGPPLADWGALAQSAELLLPPTLAADLLESVTRLPESACAILEPLRGLGVAPGPLYESLLEFEFRRGVDESWSVHGGLERRTSGSHYTPVELAIDVVERTLSPLFRCAEPADVLQLRVCDPAVGAGIFLVAAARYLANRLQQSQPLLTQAEALTQVCRHCIFGFDRDPTAILLTRLALCQLTGSRREPSRALLAKNALLHERIDAEPFVDLNRELPEVFERPAPGFDAIVGNPPWVAYVGRATQPLSPAMRCHHLQHYLGFKRYRTLHGLFAERCAQLLRPGGRLGLVLPTSMADLEGYAPTRRAHDALCLVDEELPDLGEGHFAQVFQPSMMLLSTRRRSDETQQRAWRLSTHAADPVAMALLERLAALPKCAPALFGERGYQTSSADRRELQTQPGPGYVPLRTGTEVLEFQTLAPRLFADPSGLSGRLRSEAQWREVRVLIRQTARYPIASASDGLPFRNSIVAGFEAAEVPWPLLLAYLNSTLVRWFHFQRHRDARQGMPQLKIGHLRALPRPPDARSALGRNLTHAGRELAKRNAPLSASDRQQLDSWVNQSYALSELECQLVERWRCDNPPPRPRSRRIRDSSAVANDSSPVAHNSSRGSQ